MDFPNSVPGVGLVANRFVDENPVAGTPGSLIPAAWGNAVTLELLAVIQAAGLAPAEGDVDQLAEAIGKIIADGLHKTQAQFDSSKKLATTEFVQRTLGSLRAETVVNTSTTLTAAAIGQLIVGAAGTYTTTLPLAGSVPAGSCIWFEGAEVNNWLVQRQASDVIDNNGGGTFFSIGAGDTAILESNGVATWRIIGGSLSLKSAALFGASSAGSGYQKLPTGLIIQWGTAGAVVAGGSLQVNYPIAFPNNMFMTLAGNSFTGGANSGSSTLGVKYNSLANFLIYEYGSAGQPNSPWIAIGN